MSARDRIYVLTNSNARPDDTPRPLTLLHEIADRSWRA